MEWKQLSTGYHGKRVERRRRIVSVACAALPGKGWGGKVCEVLYSSDSQSPVSWPLAFSQLNSMTVLSQGLWKMGWWMVSSSMFFFNKSLALAIFSHKVVSKQTKKKDRLMVVIFSWTNQSFLALFESCCLERLGNSSLGTSREQASEALLTTNLGIVCCQRQFLIDSLWAGSSSNTAV